MTATVFSLCKLVAVAYVLHVLLGSHNGFIYFTCKHIIIGIFHLKIFCVFCSWKKKEHLATLSPHSPQMGHVLSSSVPMWTASLLYISFWTPISIFIIIPDKQKKLLGGGEKEQKILNIFSPHTPPPISHSKNWLKHSTNEAMNSGLILSPTRLIHELCWSSNQCTWYEQMMKTTLISGTAYICDLPIKSSIIFSI